jgi:hypothetical protein
MQGRWLLGGALIAGLAGCGLGLSGLGADGEIADAGSRSDGAATAPSGAPADAGATNDTAPAAVEAAPPLPCTATLPAGWSLALYETGRASCPADTSGSHDAVAGGDAGPGACTCSCEMGGPVSCETGTLQMASGAATATCGGPTTSVIVNSEFCAPLPKAVAMPAYLAVPTLPPSGSCTATVATNPADLTKDDVRWCDVSDGGAEGICAGSAPVGFAACIVHAGTTSCPDGSAFAARTLVSDDVTLSCSACSSCTLTGTCGSATVAFFSDDDCNNAVIGLTADGTCSPTDVASLSVSSVLYNATVADAGSCVGGGTSATVAPTGATATVCCR